MSSAPSPTHPVLLAEHQQDGRHTLSLQLPLDLQYFEGHFPQLPVLPGLVQVAWALELAAPRLGTPTHCRRMEMLKFQQLLRPGDRVELTLMYEAARHRLHFTYQRDGADVSSGRLVWEAT
ncbi:acyl-CoA synthetase [Dyella subtropica]|uniref:ApeI family dehydratase n=1 Tax=Dyella subtropica TaxID=2992127 RepID=UPI00224CC67D|nr:acyl-CoA synthetase [Dyella subtropica]